MHVPPGISPKDPSKFNQWASRQGLRITLVSLLLIISYSLFPFQFSNGAHFSWQWFVARLSWDELSDWTDLAEWLVNLLLYATQSYGLTSLLQRHRWQPIAQFVLVTVVCVGLAVLTESLQAFLPGRNPNLTDLLVGSLGGFVGCLVFHLYWFRSLKIALASFVGYMVLTFLLSMSLPPTNDFRNWDVTFPLLVGNEQTGDRPWAGSLSELQIFNRSISQPEVARLLSSRTLADDRSLVAAYSLTGQGDYPDLTGHLPALAWKGAASTGKAGVVLNAQQWLETTAPAIYLTNQIKETGELAISFTVASGDLSQTGPARIVSLSRDVLHRNFTLGQQADALVLRFRTATTGNAGSTELPIPGIFLNTKSHHFVITYTNTVFNVYVDSLQNSYTVSLFPIDRTLVYYTFIFIPLGLLLGLVMLLSHRKSFSSTFAVLTSAILPALILESLLSSTDNRNFSSGNVLLSLMLMIGACLLTQGMGQLWRRSTFTQFQ
ncbi:VanZ family protein [Phormidium tenue FACHB-886]|nr:VanZ family protein [Phormidium tenue FACHB-886]